MKYTATGVVKEVFPEFQVSSTFKKREVIIDTSDDAEKPCLIKFEAIQDSVECLNNFKAGDAVDVDFYLNGRKWQKTPQDEVKYFMSAKLTRINLKAHAQQQAPPAPAFEPPAMPDLNAGGVPEEDVPFAKLGDFDQ